LQVNFTDIGSVYQDERNRAALLLYKDGDRDQYLMVSRLMQRTRIPRVTEYIW
jgi:hypothetical protein